MELIVDAKQFEKGLPKWPALVVKGKPVTPEQAMEIIIRTDNFYFGCNDRDWEKIINRIIYGIEANSRDFETQFKEKYVIKNQNEYYEKKRGILDLYDPLDLTYITNSRIASSWIGGPHGWCSWSGKIGCSNYNIGKWPSVEEVYNDWVKVAEAFKFLDLKCQLMNCEASEEDVDSTKPVVEFRIKDGQVSVYEPKEILDYPVFGSDDMMTRFTDPLAERGCSEEKLVKAFSYVKQKNEIDKKIKSGEIWIKPEKFEINKD